MANVNLLELQECLRSLNTFADKNQKKTYIREFGQGVRSAQANLQRILESTDAQYLAWRAEEHANQASLKRAHRAYKTAQRELEAVDATGYPTHKIDYLEVEEMNEGVGAMITFLKAHSADLEFADELAGTMEEALTRSARDRAEAVQARDEYQRLVGDRINAMENAQDIIRAVRIQMRSDLGQTHKDYEAVVWPAMLAPDSRW